MCSDSGSVSVLSWRTADPERHERHEIMLHLLAPDWVKCLNTTFMLSSKKRGGGRGHKLGHLVRIAHMCPPSLHYSGLIISLAHKNVHGSKIPFRPSRFGCDHRVEHHFEFSKPSRRFFVARCQFGHF